ncbi:MAG: M20 family metallopeptidase [Crenarchaeota archaeon]|nr:M20 family metallopeptidase [Thermoproteota archaeon]
MLKRGNDDNIEVSQRDVVVREVSKCRDWIADVLMRMIEIPTVNPPGEKYLEFCNYVREVLERDGISCEILKVPDDYVRRIIPEYADYPRYILLARIGSRGPTVHFNGHYDVVPGGTGWTVTEPFKPRLVNGRIYGRGSTDMKGGIASAILALKVLKKYENDLNCRVELALVPDEEIGGETGTGYLVNVLNVRPSYVIVCEPTGIDTILIGNKGIIWLMVDVIGKQAHASTPWLGVNAFEIGVRYVCNIIDDLKRMTESRVSKYEYEDENARKATIVLGGDVRTCGKVNMVPGIFSFSIDRRVIPEENVEDVERELYEYLENKAREMSITVCIRTLQRSPPAVTDPSLEIVKILEKNIAELAGRKVRKVVCSGGLDTRYYQTKGIQAVTYGPGEIELAHQADEYVELDEVVDIAKIYVGTVLDISVRG